MVKFYGASDDLIEIDGDTRDEISHCKGEAAFLVGDKSGGIIVRCRYSPGRNGVWCFSAEHVDEGVPVPWMPRYEWEHPYSLALVIECPAGTPVTRLLPSAQKGGE